MRPSASIRTRFNQDASCVLLCGRQGLQVFSCTDARLLYEGQEGATSTAAMLYQTSLLAFVGAGMSRLCLFTPARCQFNGQLNRTFVWCGAKVSIRRFHRDACTCRTQ